MGVGVQSLGVPLDSAADDAAGPTVPTGAGEPAGVPADAPGDAWVGDDGAGEPGGSVGPNVQPAPVGLEEHP
jgi:hypothetical protein